MPERTQDETTAPTVTDQEDQGAREVSPLICDTPADDHSDDDDLSMECPCCILPWSR